MRVRSSLATRAGLGLLLALSALTSTGCVLRGYRAVPVRAQPECRPDQYWDGTMCRHKGQGHGARKHDGR